MVKSKQANLVPAHTKRKKSSANLCGEDEWVIVKKQRINIIIPPSPVSNPKEVSDEQMHSDSSIPKTIRADEPGFNSTESVPEDVGAVNRVPVSADRNAIFEQRIRTVLIEKRLKRVGGLSKWLLSLGLGRFIKIFECNGVGKYQLACLTMAQLKEMGAFAVGPRRKLLHAIDRLCQPYCGR